MDQPLLCTWPPQQTPTDEAAESRAFFLDQSSILFTGALSFLASLAVNTLVQSIFKLSVPETQANSWQTVIYALIYVIIVVVIALALTYPISRSKSKRDKLAKDEERKIPILTKSC